MGRLLLVLYFLSVFKKINCRVFYKEVRVGLFNDYWLIVPCLGNKK